jgi:hypothetical protein
MVTSVALVVANALYSADHVRQRFVGLDWEILAGGTAISVLAVITLVVTLRHDRRAPLMAVAVVADRWTIADNPGTRWRRL